MDGGREETVENDNVEEEEGGECEGEEGKERKKEDQSRLSPVHPE